MLFNVDGSSPLSVLMSCDSLIVRVCTSGIQDLFSVLFGCDEDVHIEFYSGSNDTLRVKVM